MKKWLIAAMAVAMATAGCGKKSDSKTSSQSSASSSRSGNQTGNSKSKSKQKLKQQSVVVGLEIGNLAPEIEAEDIDGKTFKLSDYRGKVVLLDFWGHW